MTQGINAVTVFRTNTFSCKVYYVGHGTIVPSVDARGPAKWLEAMYIAMERNSVHVSDHFRLPYDSVVLIGRRIAI